MDTVKEGSLVALVIFGILVLPIWALLGILVVELVLFVSFTIAGE
jgi:hypothetical protein